MDPILNICNYLSFFRLNDVGGNLWIGLYNEAQLNGFSNCTCDGCEECRNKFAWLDDRAGPGYIEWANNEPQKVEACVRLTHVKVAGYVCSNNLRYICYEGL